MKISAILAVATTTLVALATADQTAPNNTTSSKCILGCPKIIKPVCGSDGVTYKNQCLFDAAKCVSGDNTLSVKHDGECKAAAKCDVMCPKNYKPVCGSDGVTYGNECEFEAAKCVGGASTSSLVVKHTGVCKAAAKCNMACPEIYKPVCGSDGVTYGNECEFEAAKCVGGDSTSSLVVKHTGVCK